MEVICPFCRNNLTHLLMDHSKDKFLFNARKNGSMRASRIRNFTVHEETGPGFKVWIVTAWVSDSESQKMGIFENEAGAKEFLDKLHKQIEEFYAE